MQADLKNGMAAVEVYNIIDVIEIEEYEDEGTGFFLVLDDGRVLCVIGQDMYPYAHDSEAQPDEGIADERALFPQTKIEYIFAPESKIRLGVKGIGETLRPRSVVKTHKKLFKKNGYVGPCSDTFYEGSIEDVLKNFGYEEKPIP